MLDVATNSQAATRVRFGVLAFTCALAAITYLDRAAIGISQSHLLAALNLHSIDEMAATFTAFSIAYALFEVPAGWLGDVFGPRSTLIRIVVWWSLFTAMTALVGVQVAGVTVIGLQALTVIRFLFGMGEAGAFPNITRALHNWFPVTERGRVQGFIWMSARLMGGLTPMIWMLLVEWIGLSWRSAFVLFGAVGIMWCVAFARWFRNRPEDKPEVNAAELALIRKGDDNSTQAAHARVQWGILIRSRNVWALCLMYFAMSYGWYFNIWYLPAFIEEMHGIPRTSVWGSIFKGGPLILGAIGCILGGWLTDRLLRRTGNRRWSRRVFGMIGHGLCVPLYLFCLTNPSAWLFALAIGMTGFFNDLAISAAWATCQDIGRRHAAIVAGCMNTIGNLGGAAAAWLVGWFLAHSRTIYYPSGIDWANHSLDAAREALKSALLPGYHWSFLSFAGMYAVAVVLWLCIDASQPVFPEDEI